MMNVAITNILVKKYNNYKIYVLNLSSFDGIFFFDILASLEKVKPNLKKVK
jgi:hypothetical protein